MSLEERFGTRDRSYSAWHRRASLSRFVGIERAQLASMCDVDAALWLEHDDLTKEPLALIETARDIGQPFKSGTVLERLARRARVPAFVVMYRLGDAPNPADPTCRDVAGFRVRRIYPRAEATWRELSPPEWADGLLRIRTWSAARFEREAANDQTWSPRAD
jgi:hypothetical protein